MNEIYEFLGELNDEDVKNLLDECRSRAEDGRYLFYTFLILAIASAFPYQENGSKEKENEG